MNHDKEITLEEFHELVRSKATRTAAKEFGRSDIGRAVRRNRSGRLRSRLREEDEPNRQERGTGPIKTIVSKASSTIAFLFSAFAIVHCNSAFPRSRWLFIPEVSQRRAAGALRRRAAEFWD